MTGQVWASALRKGLAYHLVGDGRATPCGRWHGGRAALLRGHLLSLDDAKARSMQPCARCHGTAEVVAPRPVRRSRP